MQQNSVFIGQSDLASESVFIGQYRHVTRSTLTLSLLVNADTSLEVYQNPVFIGQYRHVTGTASEAFFICQYRHVTGSASEAIFICHYRHVTGSGSKPCFQWSILMRHWKRNATQPCFYWSKRPVICSAARQNPVVVGQH